VLAIQGGQAFREVRNEISIDGAALKAEWTLRPSRSEDLRAGLELILNLLAPDAPDRYFVFPDQPEKPRLNWTGEAHGDCIALVDEWLDVRINVRVRPAPTWWIYPIFTVSQSEGGFEKVYQGSSILPHWPAREEVNATLRMEFGPAR